MSVYTPVSRDQLETFLDDYSLGKLVDYHGISSGIENTNYFVTTTSGDYVLTLFEHLTHEELPFFLELMAFLSEHEVPSAHPVADRRGRYLRELNQRPTALVHRLRGRDVKTPTPPQCRALGEVLGRMHRVGMDFSWYRSNARGPHWWTLTAERVLPYLEAGQAELLRGELRFQAALDREQLPRGVIHADLFRDNVLFEGNTLCGLIDFYYACNDILLFDVAVTVNDWCSHGNGELDAARLAPFLNAYVDQRPFTPLEQASWQGMLRAAALRFWLSRLKDFLFPREGEITHIKDPTEFQRILEQRVNRLPEPLPGHETTAWNSALWAAES